MTPDTRSTPNIRAMKLWLTITDLYHFTAWLVGLESFANVPKPVRAPWL